MRGQDIIVLKEGAQRNRSRAARGEPSTKQQVQVLVVPSFLSYLTGTKTHGLLVYQQQPRRQDAVFFSANVAGNALTHGCLMLKPAATAKQSCTLPSEMHVALVELRWLTRGLRGRLIGRATFEGGPSGALCCSRHASERGRTAEMDKWG